MESRVSAVLGEFCLATIEARIESGPVDVGAVLEQAIDHYLADSGLGREAWMYPRFRREAIACGPATTQMPLQINRPTWEAFAAEAARQRVSVTQLLEHAALYFTADLLSAGGWNESPAPIVQQSAKSTNHLGGVG